jgi:hypothetical protein
MGSRLNLQDSGTRWELTRTRTGQSTVDPTSRV